MRPLAPALALALLLAGCLSGAEEVAPAAAKPEAAAQTSEVADAMANATEETMAIVAAPLAYSGNTGTGACVFPAGTCEFAQPGTEDYHLFEILDGKPVHLVATFTFPEQKPGMSFYVGFCSGATPEDVSCDDYQAGASPFLREFDLGAFPEGSVFGFSVGSLNSATEAAGFMVFMDSTFEMAGEMHLLR